MKHITAIALLIAATFVTAGKAIAQDYAVRATIPFSFTVNGKQLPAGNYTLGSDITSPRVLKISDRTQHASAMVLTMPSADEKRKANQLVFHKYGDQYFLCEIRSQESSINVELPTTKQEKRAKAETEQAGVPVHSEVMIALN
jgi:hypothetical protein